MTKSDFYSYHKGHQGGQLHQRQLSFTIGVGSLLDSTISLFMTVDDMFFHLLVVQFSFIMQLTDPPKLEHLLDDQAPSA